MDEFEPYEGNVYDGNDQDDMGFYADFEPEFDDEENNDMDAAEEYVTDDAPAYDLDMQYEDRCCYDGNDE